MLKERLSEWIKQYNTTIWCLKETYFMFKAMNKLKLK